MSPRTGRAAGSREGRREDTAQTSGTDVLTSETDSADVAGAEPTGDSTDTPGTSGTPEPTQGPDRAQYVLAAFLAAVGVWTLVDSAALKPGFKDQVVQPSTFGFVIGAALVVLAVALAVATARGDRPEPEAGEDVDLGTGTDWRTLLGLAGVLAGTVALLDTLGWAIVGALLFAGAATVLGNRHWVRNLVIGAVLSVGTWYGFYVGLGIPIPAGILDGVL